MKFLEKDLEQIIFETENDVLEDRGLFIAGKKLRQVKLGNYGVIDLLTIERCTDDFSDKKIYKKIHVGIYELKLNEINLNALMQSMRYLIGVQEFIKERYSDFLFEYSINLIGSKLDFKNDDCFLLSFINQVNTEELCVVFYEYDFDINGMNFNKRTPYYKKSYNGF